MALRKYQKETLNNIIRSQRKGNKNILLQAATGSGKTVMASAFVNHSIKQNKNVQNTHFQPQYWKNHMFSYHTTILLNTNFCLIGSESPHTNICLRHTIHTVSSTHSFCSTGRWTLTLCRWGILHVNQNHTLRFAQKSLRAYDKTNILLIPLWIAITNSHTKISQNLWILPSIGHTFSWQER